MFVLQDFTQHFSARSQHVVPQVHRHAIGSQGVQPQDQLLSDLSNNTQIFKAPCTKVSSTSTYFQEGDGPPRHHLHNVWPTQLPLGLSCDDVRPANGYRHPSVNGYKAWLVSYPSLSYQSVISTLSQPVH